MELKLKELKLEIIAYKTDVRSKIYSVLHIEFSFQCLKGAVQCLHAKPYNLLCCTITSRCLCSSRCKSGGDCTPV